MFWGFSEALDLYNEYLTAIGSNEELEQEEQSENDQSSIDILLYGAGDPRHILTTIAKLYTQHSRNEKLKLNFYIVDGCIEIVARNIALLAIALESPQCLTLLNKVHLFMDVYGNSLIRPSSNHYLASKARTLLKMVTDNEYMQRIAPAFNIDSLKYRERDGLENSFNFWLPKDSHVFNIQKYWTDRVRQLLGVRFDYREGAFDWDLQMNLKDRGTKQICSQEYRFWRETGIAFIFPEYEQAKSNKTLSAGLLRNAEKYQHRGYLGDIQVGPFLTFGLKTCDDKMTKSAHGENEYRATDICERNLLEIFHEIQDRSKYQHDDDTSRKYGSITLEMGKTLTSAERENGQVKAYDQPWIEIPRVSINFLSADEILTMQDVASKWKKFFDVVFVGQNYFAFMREHFVNVLKEKAVILFETKLYTLCKREALNEFDSKVKSFARAADLKGVTNYSAINGKNSVLKFKISNNENLK